MRWDNLFDDLESQLEQGLTADEVDLHAEEERLRLARLTIRDRVLSLHRAGADRAGADRAGAECDSAERLGVETAGDNHGDRQSSRRLRLVLRDGSRISVTPVTFGRDWFAGDLADQGRRSPSCIVPFDAIAALSLTRQQVQASLDPGPGEDAQRSLSARLGLGFVLRDVCRRRAAVELLLAEGTFYGTLDRVGRDHCDLAVHEPGGVRRESSVTEYRVIRFTQLLMLRM